MKQQLKFWLARWLGKPHSRVLPRKDGVETTIIGHLWRDKFYASDLKQKIVDPVAHKNAIRQMMGRSADEKRIVVPGGRR